MEADEAGNDGEAQRDEGSGSDGSTKVNLNPQFFGAELSYGNALTSLGDFDNAISIYRALSLCPATHSHAECVINRSADFG
jgi:hypothetical protein